MASNTIELKLISCKDVKAFNFFQKLSVYAIVALGTGEGERGNRKQLQKTPIDREGGGNPEWNHELRFDLSQIPSPGLDPLFVEIDLLCEGIFGDKNVGEVRVPVSDLFAESNNGITRFVSYQVRCADGKPNGVLNFSYKVVWSEKNGAVDLSSVFPFPTPGTTYPPENQQAHEPPQFPAATPAIEYVHEPQYALHAPLQVTNCCYPPPPEPIYYPPPPPLPATFCYPPLEADSTYYQTAAYGVSFFSTGYPTVDRPATEEPWRRYGYPTLEQTESRMCNTFQRGLYPTIG